MRFLRWLLKKGQRGEFEIDSGLKSLITVFIVVSILLAGVSVLNIAARGGTWSTSSALSFLADNGYTAYADPSGTFYTNSVIPNANNTYDLGAALTKWRNVFVAGTVSANQGSFSTSNVTTLIASSANISSLTAATGRTATYVIAASDAPAQVKVQADVTSSGVAGSDDELVQAAVTAGYRDIYLSEGTFSFNDSVRTTTLHHGTIRGAGKSTMVTWATGTNATGKFLFDLGDAGNMLMRWTIRDLFLTCNGANVTGGSGLRGFFNYALIDNVKVDNFNEYGIWEGAFSNGVQMRYLDTAAYPLAAAPVNIIINKAGDSWVIDSIIGGSSHTETGLNLYGQGTDPTQSVWIERNYFNDCQNPIYGTEVQNLKIRDNIIHQSYFNSIYLVNSALNATMRGIDITDNIFSWWGAANAWTTHAINISPQNNSSAKCTELRILNNHFYGDGVSQNVIQLNASDRYANGQISGNDFQGFATAVFPTVATGIQYVRNTGYVTENSGTATLLNGQTTVVFAHDMNITPTHVSISWKEDPTNLIADWWWTADGTNITFNSVDPGASNLDFSWDAK